MVEGFELGADDLVELGESLLELEVLLLTLGSELLRDCAAADDEAVVSLELSGLVDDGVDDQSIEALQECCAQVLMQEMDVPETKDLGSIGVVPAAQTV